MKGRRAWNIINRYGDIISTTANPMFGFKPRDEIMNLVVNPGSTNVVFTWDLYNTEKSCKVLVQTAAITSTSDTSDTALPAGHSPRTTTVSDLTTATAYNYRITCGTARMVGSFTTD